MGDLRARVYAAVVDVGDADPDEVGADVTAALCGHRDHDGPCRWPHDNAVENGTLRTVVVVSDREKDSVRALIETALDGWVHEALREIPVPVADAELAERLLSGPRASSP